MKRANKGIAKATTIANTIATTMNIRGMNAWNTTSIATSIATESAGSAKGNRAQAQGAAAGPIPVPSRLHVAAALCKFQQHAQRAYELVYAQRAAALDGVRSGR